jgi:AcrR family transcriptional regulator
MPEPDATRQRVLEAAGPLFAERGFEATSVRDITDRVGTSPAAVNYHFRSKEHLYIETVKHAAEACNRLSPMPEWPSGVPAEVRLRDFIHAMLMRLLRDDVPTWHRQLIMREVSHPRAGACEAFVESFVRPTSEILRAIIRDLTPPDLPPAQLPLLVYSVVGQCMHYYHARHVLALLLGPEAQRGFTIDLLTDHIHAFSLAALRGLYPDAKANSKKGGPP